MRRKTVYSLLLLSLSAFLVLASSGIARFPLKAAEKEERWAEAVLDRLTLEEKIAQLLMIRVHSHYDEKMLSEIETQIRLYQPGGVCFFKGTPLKQLQLTNLYQRISNVPLLVSIDGEWGPAMRLDSCAAFPRQMALGAMDESGDSLIREMGREIGRQCNALGIHINFAPCVDVNNNPANPVINSRSFGEDRKKVARKATQYMLGLQETGVSACAKHFPGHGDTDIDSHRDLPVIKKNRKELENTEFYPFQTLINQGVDMVMISHLNVPSLDAGNRSIATLSFKIVTTILRKEMGFDGLVITDAMDMLGLRNSFPEGGEAEIRALLAGVDILLLPNELPIVIAAIKEAVENGRIELDMINEKCLRVLKFKQSKHLETFTPLPTESLSRKLNSAHSLALVDQLAGKSLTLLKNEKGMLPLRKEDFQNSALLCIGGLEDSAQWRQIAQEKGFAFHQVPREITPAHQARMDEKLKPYPQVIVAVLGTNQSPRYNYGICKESVDYIHALAKTKRVILSLHGNPYALRQFAPLTDIPAILIAYQPTPASYRAALDALSGHQTLSGTLPVRIEGYPLGSGIVVPARETPPLKSPPHRPGSSKPDHSSPLSDHFFRIDSILRGGIQNRIYPGCQVVAVYEGKTILDTAYGYHTYDKQTAVEPDDLYDVASITKAMATTLAVMKLYEEGKIQVEAGIGRYLPFLRGSDKENLTVAELMTHTSGLPAYIPFYKKAMVDKEWNPAYLTPSKKEQFNIPVAAGLYAADQYPVQILEEIQRCPLGSKSYRYSDLGFILLKEVVEHIAGQGLDTFLMENIYQPMGLRRTAFNPLSHGFALREIVPTEKDTYFRMQWVHGYVHDQTAALFGGVSGHAGLFTTARELAALAAMLMTGGRYGEKTIFKQETVRYFTQTYPIHGCQRRSLGFDTPSFAKPGATVPAAAGNQIYGHQGFTGTVFWCDPQHQLVYIFLSNRVCPDAEPNKLSQSKIRLLIHEEIYKALAD